LSYYVCINKTAWDEAGLGDIPTEWTWDEYLEACRAMTKYNDDGTVAMYGGSDYHSVNYWTYRYGQVVGSNAYYNEDGTASSFDNEILKKALTDEYNAEVVEKIWFPKSVYRADNLQTQMVYCGLNQDVHCASAITPNITRFLADQENYPTDYITAFAPFPTMEEGQTNYMSGVSPFSHSGITIGCQDEEASWAFLKWYSTYGVKYLVAAGHQPNWLGTDPADALTLLFGSEEEAAKIVDVESFKNVVGVSTNPYYYEDTLTGYSDVNNIVLEYTMYVLNDTMSVDEALETMTELANEAIANAD
jgi:multiple sugar transport system substrate-binding protein